MAGQIAAVEVEECNRNWTVAALKERTKEREAHFELAALEIFDELDAFVTAGRVHRAPRKRVEEPFEQLPKYGLACDEKAERSLDEIMKSIDEWGLDVHSISQHSRGHPLTVVAYTIFKQRDLFKFLGISALTFLNCMLDLEAKYNSEPTYHNAVHAADVVHTVHVILNGTALRVSQRFLFTLRFQVIHSESLRQLSKLNFIQLNTNLALSSPQITATVCVQRS